MEKELIEVLRKSIQKFYEKDSCLAKRGGMEQSCVFRIALYLNQLLESVSEFSNFDLDCEYNKNGNQPKAFSDNEKYGVRPDLILHKRGANDHNILIVEFKTKHNYNKNDELKLKKFTEEYGRYGYYLGVFVRLMDTYENTLDTMKYYKNGNLIKF